MSKNNMEDWVECELGEIVTIQTGKHDANHATQNGKYRFYTCAFEYLRCNTKKFSGECIILPGNGANVGEVFFYNGEFDAYQRTYVLNKIKINPKYVFYHLKGFWKLLNIDKQFGTATNYIRMMNFTNYKLPICSNTEQNAIVKKIEKLFSNLDSGIDDLKQAQDKLKLYRQAVLQKAFEGKLTKNIKYKKLIDISSKIGSGSTPKGGKASYKKKGTPLIRSLNIHFDFIKYEGLAFIDDKQATKLNNVIVKEGDVLLNITGASIGRVNIAPKNLNNARVNQHVSIIRPKDNMFNSKYLKLYLQSTKIQNWIKNVNYGVTRQALTKNTLENLEIPLPPIKEQAQIVEEIEKRLSVCKQLEKTIETGLEQAKLLRQSILKKAFNGELLSKTEIQLCKEDKDYMPAKELLKKIRMDRN